jgi:hypothetical protein
MGKFLREVTERGSALSRASVRARRAATMGLALVLTSFVVATAMSDSRGDESADYAEIAADASAWQQAEALIQERYESLVERRRAIEEASASAVTRSRVVPALSAGTSAIELMVADAKGAEAPASVSAQLAALTDELRKQGLLADDVERSLESAVKEWSPSAAADVR